MISKRKYDFLKQFEGTLSDEEREMVDNYEKGTKVHYKPLKKEIKREPIKELDVKELKKEFLKTFESEQGKKLVVTENNKEFLNVVAHYFARSGEFEQTNITQNIPSLDKGLLIIGGYGCGKSSMFKTFHKIGYKLLPDKFMWFPYYSCNALVSEFEKISSTNDRGYFMEKYTTVKVCYFDDFGTENDASNYGKKNLMKDILEERYTNNKRTYVSTNLSLEEIGERYGERIYDRLQEMFNIIIMKGESFRR